MQNSTRKVRDSVMIVDSFLLYSKGKDVIGNVMIYPIIYTYCASQYPLKAIKTLEPTITDTEAK
jgi:hypothetical protein